MFVEQPDTWETTVDIDFDEDIKDQKILQDKEYADLQVAQSQRLYELARQSGCNHKYRSGYVDGHVFVACKYCGKEFKER